MFKTFNPNKKEYVALPKIARKAKIKTINAIIDNERVSIVCHEKESVPVVSNETEIGSLSSWQSSFAINAFPLRQEKLKLDDLYETKFAKPKNNPSDKVKHHTLQASKNIILQKMLQSDAREKRIIKQSEALKLSALRKLGVFNDELEDLYFASLVDANICDKCFKVLRLESYDDTFKGKCYKENHKAFFEIHTQFVSNEYHEIIGVKNGKVKNRKAKTVLHNSSYAEKVRPKDFSCVCYDDKWLNFVDNEIERFEKFALEFYAHNPLAAALSSWIEKRNDYEVTKHIVERTNQFYDVKEFKKNRFSVLDLAYLKRRLRTKNTEILEALKAV